MEQVPALVERIRRLKEVAASMHEGAIHTAVIPEIDKVLALPEALAKRTVADLEAITRQVREYEGTFDSLGYSLLDQLMPTTGVSSVFKVVRAKDRFRQRLRDRIGQSVTLDGQSLQIDGHVFDVLTRYGLSIGTPPVTAPMRQLISRTVFGREVERLADFIEVLEHPPQTTSARLHHDHLVQLLQLLTELVDSSTHYCTAAEEQSFLREAAEFINFEGGRLFNRVVITESPRRVIYLIERYVFDKFGPQGETPVRLVEGVDRLDRELIAQMKAEPNKVFVAQVTRIPYRLFQADSEWLGVIGRLLLIDCSAHARQSNTTVVYPLFPHVARTLRNIQTSFAGRPANTQLQLRRVLERFASHDLTGIHESIERRLQSLENEGVLAATVDQIRAQEWTRANLFSYLSLAKLRRMVGFLEALAKRSSSDEPLGDEHDLRRKVAQRWMRYFYKGLPAEHYSATVVPGGGRGALTMVGEYHGQRTRQEVERFCQEHLEPCRRRLHELKQTLEIPSSSTDEIEAAIKQSQLRALSPSQWKVSDDGASLADHLARTMVYRAADAASRVADRAREGLDRAAFGNVTGGAAAFFKRALSKSGFGALHGRLEDVIGDRVADADRRVRDLLAPIQEFMRQTQRSLVDFKGELDPVAVSEIEAMLNVIEQGHFYPTLILAEMSWTYHDVFPEKDFPPYSTIRIPLNARHEMDPVALLSRLEALRYLFRRFPEVFELLCKSILLVLNTPHNPTGVVYRRETVLKLLQIAAAYGITVLDDNAYHKLLTREQKAREGDHCVAQIYETYRTHFAQPVRLLTAGATTKGLQGAGDRTGLLHANDPEAVAFVEQRASEPHHMSLYLTQLKLESGLAAKRYTREIERLAGELLDPTAGTAPWQRLKDLLADELSRVQRDDFPVAVFEVLLAGYERLLRLKQRGATRLHLSQAVSDLVGSLKQLRLERALRSDVQQRIEQARMALLRVKADADFITPQGAFYCCVRLCAADDDRGVQPFLEAIAAARGVDFTYAGQGFVRMSLGGKIAGDRVSYDRLGLAVEVYTRLLLHYWQRFNEQGRFLNRLETLFAEPGEDPLAAALRDLQPLLGAHPQPTGDQSRKGRALEPSERGLIYCIEEGRSVADKVFIEADNACETVEQMLQSRAFRVLFRRLLRKVHRQESRLVDLSFEQVENQYGPLACLTAYQDRQLMDDVFRDLLRRIYRAWHGADTVKILAARLEAGSHGEKTSALQGINRKVNELINELMHAFAIDAKEVDAASTFEVGYEVLEGIAPHDQLPDYLQRIVSRCCFAGATEALTPDPRFTTGAVKRVSDYRYGFIRRDAHGEGSEREAPPLSYFQTRLAQLPATDRFDDYVLKAVQVGPFKMLLMLHKSCFHLISDELRLFPQIEEVQLGENLQRLAWDGVLLFGVPSKLVGDSYKTGYILDQYADGALLPTAWVAREDATDYVGFLKKSLLTLHNERVKAMGGMPVHGAMITITFKNGLRKTLVFSADSGTGKSETITAMMEQMISGGRLAGELDRVDILAGDMLSLWRGADEQIYAFGTETGDFMRLTDITESWQQQFGDLLKRGSYSNLDHPKNPRVTIPGICNRLNVLRPTRVNGFFYINNYEAAGTSSVEIVEDPHQVLKQILVRGLRKNKGTSGDQPSLRAGLEFAGRRALVTRFRYRLDQLLQWETRTIEGKQRTCLAYRDGAEDVYAAREVIQLAFKGQRFEQGEQTLAIQSVDYDIGQNLFWLGCGVRRRVVLDREVYDQIYEPLVSTFCGNPFVDPAGMDRTLGVFAETMRRAKVHTGTIKTQLARPGYEFAGPAKAAEDIVDFLLEDEEVNARFQRNKNTIHQAMQRTYGGVLKPGTNLPVELEGYNLLLLEEHESTHVPFHDGEDQLFTIPTPYYHFASPKQGDEPFRPAIALPEHIATIVDIYDNPDYELPLSELEVDLDDYAQLSYWNSIEELTYQVLLINGVITLGSSETELARFPLEVCKARHVAELIVARRQPSVEVWAVGGRVLSFDARGE